MSRRYSQSHNNNNNNNHRQQPGWTNNNNRNFATTQKKFVSKNQNPNSPSTLSNSLRQLQSNQYESSAAASSSLADGSLASSSRVRKGDDGERLSSRAITRAQGGGSFVNYLPQDEAVAAGLGADEGGLDPVESQRVVDLLNRELTRLLKLKPRDFWREVAGDTSLHEFLDSFLKFRSRWYDFPHHGAKGIVAGVIVGELELCRRVFMVLYRISSNKDPGAAPADSYSSKDHSALLQEKKLLDLPKLLDICAIYGHENEELTGLLVRNALKAQPGIHDNLPAVISHFLGLVHTMHQRCISSLEALFSSGIHDDHGPSLLLTDFVEVIDFINDAIVSMDAFITAYKPAALFFSCPVEVSYGNEELLISLARLHDTLLPYLQRGFRVILMGGDDGMILNIAISLKMLSMRMINFGWKLLDFCYLGDQVFEDCLSIPAIAKMFPAKVEDPVIRADILIQTFREINGVLLYTQENQKWDTFLQNLDKNYHIISRLQSLQNAGWIFMDDEQLQYLIGIMRSTAENSAKEPTLVPTAIPSNKVQMDEDAAITESKISQIRDLFPDYGKGFLAACLEVYNQNPEEVIQRILEGNLHEDLQCLDASLETMPQPKSALALSRQDKGKGKLVETISLPLTTPVETILLPSTAPIHYANPAVQGDRQDEGASVSSSSTAGRFVRKSNDMPDRYTVDTRDDKDAARTVALIAQYEYEDEYDDSFDDLGLSVAGLGVEENEILSDRISSNFGRSLDSELETSATAPDTKWGSKKKPQYYVKDGKNYSYKVEGSVAAANANEASLINQAQRELIYGLGRGGNVPMGRIRMLEDQEEEQNQSDEPGMDGRGNPSNPRGGGRARGRGRRGGGRMRKDNEQENQSDGSEGEGRGNAEHFRGRGRGRGRASQQYRKNRAMNKHFSGLSGF